MSESIVDDFEACRTDMERLAYRMLGTRADSDEIVQEAYLRWMNVDRATVRSPHAYLTSVVTRLCIDRRQEIEKRNETYVGPWLPEPIVRFEQNAAEDRVEMAETITFAFMQLLETLTPAERAAYLLRRVFDYDYAQIGEVLNKSEASCRQLVSRAESSVLAGRPRFAPSAEELQRLSNQFLQACATGDIGSLVSLLAEDVVIYSDGGGKATAALRPIEGANAAARFLVGIFKKAPPGTTIKKAIVNEQFGFVAYNQDQPIAVWSFEFSDERLQSCHIIRNPDKLVRVRTSSESRR